MVNMREQHIGEPDRVNWTPVSNLKEKVILNSK